MESFSVLKCNKISLQDDQLVLETNLGVIIIYFLTQDIIRFRCTYQPEDQIPSEQSLALVLTAWPDEFDELLKEERRRISLIQPNNKIENQHTYECQTQQLKLIIQQFPFSCQIYSIQDNKLLHSDLQERSYLKDQKGRIYHYSTLNEKDKYYGLGEKTGPLNQIKRRWRMSNVDTLGFQPQTSDPLYQHIPYYIQLIAQTNQAVGYFYHNSFNSEFDVGCQRSGYWPRYSYFTADGGEADWFFMYGPGIKRVVELYTDLTGQSFLPPKYSLGYMGSTMYYTELEKNCDEAVINFIKQTVEVDIPCDGFHLSSGYTQGGDGRRYVFNWNLTQFPDPKNFITTMQQKYDVQVSPNVKPAMLLGHPLYDEFEKAGAFIMDRDGQQPHIDRYWGGQASFIDFTNPVSRKLWKSKMKQSLLDNGIRAIWNDNCEYEINDPKAKCAFGTKNNPTITVDKIRPLLPNMMAQTAIEALLQQEPNKRPFVLNRAGFSGIQRYAQTWAGDNYSSWKSLQYNITTILGMGLSGVAIQSIDVGGFDGPAPQPQLFVRWVQNAVFYPRFSIHSCNTDNTVTEPWMYPSYLNIIKESINLRYKLMPYLYSLAYEASRLGSPIMRPLIYEFQDQDPSVTDQSFDFLLGPYLLVAGIFEQGIRSRDVYLPGTSDWIDYWTQERYRGGIILKNQQAPLERIPLFIRSGAIIPQSSGKKFIPTEILELLIEPSRETTFLYYEDDGTTNNYLQGEKIEIQMKIKWQNNSLVKFTMKDIGNQADKNDYKAYFKNVFIELYCQGNSPYIIQQNQNQTLQRYLDYEKFQGSNDSWYFNGQQNLAFIKFKVKLTNPQFDENLLISFQQNDLIQM